MVLLRESGMTQPLIAAAMGVSLSTVNRAHMAYDHGGTKRRTQAREHDLAGGRGRAGAFCQGRWSRRNVEHSRSQDEPTKRPWGKKPARARSIIFWPGTAGAS